MLARNASRYAVCGRRIVGFELGHGHLEAHNHFRAPFGFGAAAADPAAMLLGEPARQRPAAVRDLVAHGYDDAIVLKQDAHKVAFRQRVEGGARKDVGDDVRDWVQIASSVGGRVNQIDHHPLSTSREIRSHALEHSLHDVGQC